MYLFKENKLLITRTFLLFAFVIINSSCGVIFYGAKQKVTVNSNPPGAEVLVNGITTGEYTPAEIKVKRRVKTTPFSTKQKMTYTLKKKGYETVTQIDDSKFNYVNLIHPFFAITIDPLFGTYRRYPKNVDITLKEQTEEEYQEQLAQKAKSLSAGSMEEIELLYSKKSNLRDEALLIMQEKGKLNYTTSSTAPISSIVDKTEGKAKIKKSESNVQAVKYRRSSLYTLMINDESREYSYVIRNAFGNSSLPSKFNNHNIGPYLIDGSSKVKDQNNAISTYVRNNDIAKKMIASWFNRDETGAFNMALIADRGMYDASEIDKSISKMSIRGNAMLTDAGEELIKNTFVIVNDYKFTSKEEVAQKSGKVLSVIGQVSAIAGYDISSITDAATIGLAVAGKGYVIKTKSYLYRLVWDEETAAIFYNDHWTNKEGFDPSKVEAFNNASNYKLEFIGHQSAWADVQSSIFSDKDNSELIKMATVKATDKAIAKLQRKYEEFKTMTPIHSASPLSAKIGLKEGLKKGDKFEVLEQVIDKDGNTTYKRVGVIKVDGKQIWDNTLTDEEIAIIGDVEESKRMTMFKGSGNYYSGQLIKQLK